jgi:hypothetical protein
VDLCALGGTWKSCKGSLLWWLDRGRRPAAEVSSGGGGPVVGGHEEEAGELQGDMEKL